MFVAVLFQALRPVLLLGVILVSGPLLRSQLQPLAVGDGPDLTWWPGLVAVMIVFAVVTVVGRERRALPAALAVEGVVAAVLVLVPPIQWVVWFGVNAFTHATGGTGGPVGLMQPLAAMWLAVVASTAIRAARNGRDAERSEASVS